MGSSGHPREGRLHWQRSTEQQLHRHRSRSPGSSGCWLWSPGCGHVAGTEFLPSTADEESVASDCPGRAQVGPSADQPRKGAARTQRPLPAGRPPRAPMVSPGLCRVQGPACLRRGSLSQCSGPCLWATVPLWEPGRVRTEFAGLGGAGGQSAAGANLAAWPHHTRGQPFCQPPGQPLPPLARASASARMSISPTRDRAGCREPAGRGA